MTSISPTQLAILKAAAKTPLEDIRQHMQELKSPAIREKVLQSMIKNGLVKEAEEDGGVIYVITQSAIISYGGRRGRDRIEEYTAKDKTAETDAPKSSKQQIMVDLLKRKEGATLVQLSEATGWQKHSVHGAMAGVLKKKMGLAIASSKAENGDRVYRIA